MEDLRTTSRRRSSVISMGRRGSSAMSDACFSADSPQRIQSNVPTKDELVQFQKEVQRVQMSLELEKAEESSLERQRINESNTEMKRRLDNVAPPVVVSLDKKTELIRARIEAKRKEYQRNQQEKLREDERQYKDWIATSKDKGSKDKNSKTIAIKSPSCRDVDAKKKTSGRSSVEPKQAATQEPKLDGMNWETLTAVISSSFRLLKPVKARRKASLCDAQEEHLLKQIEQNKVKETEFRRKSMIAVQHEKDLRDAHTWQVDKLLEAEGSSEQGFLESMALRLQRLSIDPPATLTGDTPVQSQSRSESYSRSPSMSIGDHTGDEARFLGHDRLQACGASSLKRLPSLYGKTLYRTKSSVRRNHVVRTASNVSGMSSGSSSHGDHSAPSRSSSALGESASAHGMTSCSSPVSLSPVLKSNSPLGHSSVVGQAAVLNRSPSSRSPSSLAAHNLAPIKGM